MHAAGRLPQPVGDARGRDDAHFQERQLGRLQVQQTLGYLVRLNRSLLLLTKIENGQFPRRSRSA